MPALILVEEVVERVSEVTERLNVASEGKRFTCDFIAPGIVNYADMDGGFERLQKDVIEEHLNSLIGAPLTIGHIKTLQPQQGQQSHGRIDKARWNADTGFFVCEGTIETDEARAAIRDGKRPSVGYVVTKYGKPGFDRNIRFKDIAKIKFHHLGLVDNPRYTEAKIRLNAVQPKPGDKMHVFKWLKSITRPKADGTGNETVQESTDLAADSTIEIDGKSVRLNELGVALTEKQTADAAAAKAKKEADELAEAARENEITPEAEIDLGDGKKAKLSEMIAAYKTRETPEQKTARENAVAVKSQGAVKFRLIAEAASNGANPKADSAPFVDTSSPEAQLKRGKELF